MRPIEKTKAEAAMLLYETVKAHFMPKNYLHFNHRPTDKTPRELRHFTQPGAAYASPCIRAKSNQA